MSTELKPVGAASAIDSTLRLTQYAGKNREDGGDRRRVQLTQALPGEGAQFVQLSREQAAELVGALAEWLAGTRARDID